MEVLLWLIRLVLLASAAVPVQMPVPSALFLRVILLMSSTRMPAWIAALAQIPVPTARSTPLTNYIGSFEHRRLTACGVLLFYTQKPPSTVSTCPVINAA